MWRRILAVWRGLGLALVLATVQPLWASNQSPLNRGPQVSGAPAAVALEAFNAFWTRFRAAALAGDAQALAALAAPSIVVTRASDLDDAPRRRISGAARVARHVAIALDGETGTSRVDPRQTYRQVLQSLERIEPSARGVGIGREKATVACFHFHRHRGQWRLEGLIVP